jgi:hypothetical protein
MPLIRVDMFAYKSMAALRRGIARNLLKVNMSRVTTTTSQYSTVRRR